MFRSMTVVVNYRCMACDVHLCTISFDLWAPRYRFKTVIYRRQKSADSDANSESVTTLHIMLAGVLLYHFSYTYSRSKLRGSTDCKLFGIKM